MIIARLEKQPNREPHDAWWLVINGVIEPELLHFSQAIDNQTLVQKVIAARAQKFVIDLTTLSNFDSRGLLLLLLLYRQLSDENIPLVLRNPNSYLQRILRIMQVDHFFEIDVGENPKGNHDNPGRSARS
ncbi:MAG: STAS domain-containing protein [Anaerolineales bacterium]|nr:STAS domain-containing protein [Anaerolineales bacterium]